MTRDDVIRAAGEAGFHFHDAGFAQTLHTVPLEYSEKCFERFAAIIEAAATEKANERANASWSSMCEKMVAAERDAMISEAAKLGWAMKNEDPFEDAVAEVARIRARGES